MSERTFDRETILDMTVNVIPLAIIVLFALLFLVVRPWRANLFAEAISMGLLVVPFVILAVLTYASGRAIARDEAGGEGVATDGTLSSTDAEIEGAAADENGADANDRSMVEDRSDGTEDE